MSQWLTEIVRRPFRALAAFALIALSPKCVVCVVAYAGLGAALGLRGPEICGAAAGSPDLWVLSLGVAFSTAILFAGLRRRRTSIRNQRGHAQ
jgi:hypothetical protein